MDKLRVPVRMVRDRCLFHVTQSFVEGGRLETVGEQHDLDAAATNGFRFGGLKEGPAEALTAPRFVDPKMGHVTASAPGVAVDCGNNFRGIVRDGARK